MAAEDQQDGPFRGAGPPPALGEQGAADAPAAVPRLRAPSAADAAQVVRLLRAVAREQTLGVDPDSFGEAAEAERLRALDLRSACALVADVGGAIKGFAAAVRAADAATAHTATVSVAVAADARGRGLGGLLLGGLEAWARTVRVRKLCAGVLADNRSALRLFRSHGYADEGVRRGQIAVEGRLRDEVLLGRFLEGRAPARAGHGAALGGRHPRRRKAER